MRWCQFAVLVVSAAFVAACQLPRNEIVACPLSGVEQAKEVLAVAPIGTPRQQVVDQLAQAGIRGSFGTAESVFYCDLWKRPDGQIWHINVELLFDEAGRLSATRPAVAETSEPHNGPVADEPPTRRSMRRTAFDDGG